MTGGERGRRGIRGRRRRGAESRRGRRVGGGGESEGSGESEGAESRRGGESEGRGSGRLREGVGGWFRGWRPVVSMAARNLRRNRVRTVLAVLGVCIGVLAVAALGIFGNVLALGANDAIGDIGTQVVVSPNADAGVESLGGRRGGGDPARR